MKIRLKVTHDLLNKPTYHVEVFSTDMDCWETLCNSQDKQEADDYYDNLINTQISRKPTEILREYTPEETIEETIEEN